MKHPDATIAGTLIGAKENLMVYGWRQHYNNVGGYAIECGLDIHDAIVQSRGARRAEAIKFLLAVVAPECPTSTGLVDWNEKRGRTVQQVMAAFDQAIAAAKASE